MKTTELSALPKPIAYSRENRFTKLTDDKQFESYKIPWRL